MEPVKIGILGLGTVGSGTVNTLHRNAKLIRARTGRDIDVGPIAVRELGKQRDCEIAPNLLTDDPFKVVNDPEVSVVLELMGGEQDAKALVLQAIANGKHVVTANKALIAMHGNELFIAAREQGVMIAFEAAVAGGIPIIKALREGLSGNRINSIAGIINGTSNYILTEMHEKQADFSEALKDAQRLGYAEADPSFDIEGIDVAHKLAILSAIAFGVPLQFGKVTTEGIDRVTREDVEYAQRLGYRIKHLGITRYTDDGIELRVHPTLIPESRTLAHVNGVMNAIMVDAEPVGSTMYYGPGAGAGATASAVVADLVDVVRTLTVDTENRVPHLAFQLDALQDLPILPMSETVTSYYLRLMAEDKPGVLAEITRIFGEMEISIESIMQYEQELEQGFVPIVIITQRVKEQNMMQAIEQLAKLNEIKGEVTRIRLEQLNG